MEHHGDDVFGGVVLVIDIFLSTIPTVYPTGREFFFLAQTLIVVKLLT